MRCLNSKNMLSVGKDEIGYIQLYIPTDEACSGENQPNQPLYFDV